LTHFDLIVIEKNIFENLSTESYGKILLAKINDTLYLGLLGKGKGVDDVHKKLVNDKWTEALSKRTICRWIELLEAGQLSIEDTPHSGQTPRSCYTFEH